MEVVVQYLPVQHKGDGGLCSFGVQAEVREGGGFLFGPERHRKVPVRLHDGVGDIPRVEDILAAQGLHQVGGGQPQSAQGVLVDFSVQDDGLGPPGHQVEEFLAPEAQNRAQKLQCRDQEERNQAGSHRDFLAFDGDGRQIGDEDGGDQLLRLQFSQLPFAHQPHGKQDAEIDQNRAKDQ